MRVLINYRKTGQIAKVASCLTEAQDQKSLADAKPRQKNKTSFQKQNK